MALVIPSTSRTTMQMTTPPVGWTKDTSYNEFTLRAVTGSVSTGGTSDFSTVFSDYTTQPVSTGPVSLGATTLTTTNLASHQHGRVSYPGPTGTGARLPSPAPISPALLSQVSVTVSENLTGGGGAHTHPIGTITCSSISGGLDFRINYVDVIIVTRN